MFEFMTDEKTKREKFEEAARDLETDDDPARFRERLGKLVKPNGPPDEVKGSGRRGG